MKTTLPPSLKEDRSHGNQMFRFGFYKESNPDSFQVLPHWHEELEIIFFHKGHFILEINMERYEIHSEALYFIRPGELHRIFCPGPCEESAVVFSPYLLGFLSNDAAQSRLIGPLAAGTLLLPRRLLPEQDCFHAVYAEYEKIVRQCDKSHDTIVRQEAPQIFIKAALLNILGICAENHLLTSSSSSEPRNENIEGLKLVLSYIREHFSDRIYVKDLAALLNLNEQYFCRFFKKAIGQSPMAYVNEYRIRRASGMLRDTDLPITEICLECGFNNFGNFLREFRKQTGTTPLKYRQKP